MSFYLLRRLMDRQKPAKIGIERLTEPLHLKVASLFAALLAADTARRTGQRVLANEYL